MLSLAEKSLQHIYPTYRSEITPRHTAYESVKKVLQCIFWMYSVWIHDTESYVYTILYRAAFLFEFNEFNEYNISNLGKARAL